MLSNLLSNALKHAISIIEIDVSKDNESFIIKVENDGEVIPDEYVEKIFEPLFKLNKNVHGTGIGLAFVKSLVELHHGSIYCDNTKPNKTAFVMTLPVNQEHSIKIHEGNSVDLNSEINIEKISKIDLLDVQKHNSTPIILTIEDNKEFQHLLYKQLSNNYQLVQCENGKEALEIIEKESVDIIICDIMMPVMDGLEFCKTIKEDLRFSHIPVILLTAKSNLESKIEGISSGADEYIEKPYTIEYLRARIDNLLENRRKIQEAFKKSPEIAFKTLTHSKADEDFLKRLIEIIYENLDNPELNIDKLANDMAISRSTLYRKIKNVSELSPNDFIQLIRLKRSAELIKENQYQISEIAYMTGFSSPNYFSKCFFNQFGVNPKDF
jgi:DNA-binding response OmpR family regulator